MKAVVSHGIGDIRLDDVPEPKIEQPADAIVRLTASAICGTDLHMIRGTLPGMVPGTILGHEGVGVVEEVGPVKLPDEVSDHQAILLSDIFPTGYFGAELAQIYPGDTVAVLGGGPVGQFVIASAKMLGAGRILAVDTIPSRLEMARRQGAEVIDFETEDPVQVIRELTGGIGVDRAIDAVGVDSVRPHRGPAAQQAAQQQGQFQQELQEIAPTPHPQEGNWHPGDAPSQALQWAVKGLAKAGTLSIIGVYPQTDRFFPIGEAMNKNLTLNMGNCNHRKYIPMLIERVREGAIDPLEILTQQQSLTSAIEAYKAFDRREPGWVKVELMPALKAA
jgi:threonine dehydrogenase-like Zn-dependent dehydrogenase